MVAVGNAPPEITNTDATISLTNALLKTATVLDANGMAVRTLAVARRGPNFGMTLPANAMYVVLRG